MELYNDEKEVEVETDPKETVKEILQHCLIDKTTSQVERKGVNSHAKLLNLARRKALN
jgi:IS1 family transposase